MSSSRPSRLDTSVPGLTEYAVACAASGYWAAQDVENTVSTFREDIVYRLYVSRSSKPISIERVGREAVRDMLYDFLADFDYLKYETDILEARDGVVRFRSCYLLRHRATGEELSGSKRFICTVRGGLFQSIHEFHDAALVEAFVKLAKWRLKEDALAHAFRTRWPVSEG